MNSNLPVDRALLPPQKSLQCGIFANVSGSRTSPTCNVVARMPYTSSSTQQLGILFRFISHILAIPVTTANVVGTWYFDIACFQVRRAPAQFWCH